jgi:hypothetical protein
MLIRHIADTVDHFALFGQSGGLLNIIAIAKHISMQITQVTGYQNALGVVPRAGPDPGARIYGGLGRRRLLTKICTPGVISCAYRLGKILADPIGAGQSTKIAGARHCAGNEKRHGMLRLLRLALRQDGDGAKQRDSNS